MGGGEQNVIEDDIGGGSWSLRYITDPYKCRCVTGSAKCEAITEEYVNRHG